MLPPLPAFRRWRRPSLLEQSVPASADGYEETQEWRVLFPFFAVLALRKWSETHRSVRPVELVQLSLGVVFRSVAHINPVDQKLLDLIAGEVRILFLDALNGLFEIKSFCIRPDKFALPGVELHVPQQIPKGVGYLYELLILGQILQREELFEEGIIRENLTSGSCLRCLLMMRVRISG
jgi:hypothetical protein